MSEALTMARIGINKASHRGVTTLRNDSNAKHTYDMQNATKPIPELSAKDKERFWSKVEKLGNESGCWIWTAGTFKNGYGAFGASKKMLYAHRVSCEISQGAITEGMHILHKCDTKCCVNPAHLFLGTNADNIRDMVSKQRHTYGERNGMAKLTSQRVSEIRIASEKGSELQRDIAKRFGVAQSHVSAIKNRQRWSK